MNFYSTAAKSIEVSGAESFAEVGIISPESIIIDALINTEVIKSSKIVKRSPEENNRDGSPELCKRKFGKPPPKNCGIDENSRPFLKPQ